MPGWLDAVTKLPGSTRRRPTRPATGAVMWQYTRSRSNCAILAWSALTAALVLLDEELLVDIGLLGNGLALVQLRKAREIGAGPGPAQPGPWRAGPRPAACRSRTGADRSARETALSRHPGLPGSRPRSDSRSIAAAPSPSRRAWTVPSSLRTTGISPSVAAAAVTTCASGPAFLGFGRNTWTSTRATSASTITASRIRPRRERFGGVDVTSLMKTSENSGGPARPGHLDPSDRNDYAGESRGTVAPSVAPFSKRGTAG